MPDVAETRLCTRGGVKLWTYKSEAVDAIDAPAGLRKCSPRNVLVHLPDGPRPTTSRPTTNDPAVVASVSSKLPSTTLVTLDYRLSTSPGRVEHRFPIPIHDVSSALDYITSSTSPFNANEDERPKICLTGSHIGGALATMLALTEPNKIHALAVAEPMVDWISLDEILASAKTSPTPFTAIPPRKRLSTPPASDPVSLATAAQALINLRTRIFPTPSSYFDPFASPTLFLRAPGRDTPATPTSAVLPDDMAPLDLEEEYSLSQPASQDAFGPYDDDWSSPSSDTTPSITPESTLPHPKRRKVLRRWPPVGRPESLVLPHTRIFLSHPRPNASMAEEHAALMRVQGLELVELMRRACFFGREKSFAEDRVGVEYFDHSKKNKLTGMVEWVRQMFEVDEG